MHGSATTTPYFAGDLIGFTTGLLLTVLLLVLTLRAAKLPGTPLANIVFATCGILWSAGGLAHAGVLAMGMRPESLAAAIALAVKYTGAAMIPIPILAIWRPFARGKRRRAARVLWAAALISAAAIACVLWWPALSGGAPLKISTLWRITGYNAAVFVLLGAAVSLRRESTTRAVYGPSVAVVCAVAGALVMTAVARNTGAHLGMATAFLGSHLVLLGLLLTFLLFARFRYADVFIRYGVRVLLAGFWATLMAFTVQSNSLMQMARQAPTPGAVHVFVVIVLANVFLLSFTFIDDRITRALSRWLFREPDYRASLRALGAALRKAADDAGVGRAAERAVAPPLELNGAQWVGVEAAEWPAALLEGEVVELDHRDPLRKALPLENTEVLVPVAPTGRVTHVLLIAPGAERPGLVVRDLNFLRAAAAQCGNRLDALRREREAAERESREAVLQQQVTEAELRALRAQINPHFLFNSLNTIADLAVRDPARAEAMTLRLAGVFRHVLANSSRPLVPVRDEIEFLRAYLYIEEVRFGDRLHAEIELDSEIAGESIPSLILQPLVENALKHGVAPRPGPGRLWISARGEAGAIVLRVDDDGIGLPRTPSGGLGLTNVRERLATLYQDRGSLKIEAREGGGTRAEVRIPRSAGCGA